VEVTELRVVVPDEIAERLASEAKERGTSAEDVAAEVLRLHAPSRSGGHRLSFIGIGRSGSRDSVAKRHEEIIRDHFADKTAADV
jgi:hypothetical protein